MDSAERREAELEAIAAIFPPDEDAVSVSFEESSLRVRIQSTEFVIHLPHGYPAEEGCVPTISPVTRLEGKILGRMEEVAALAGGDECLLELIQTMKDFLDEDLSPSHPACDAGMASLASEFEGTLGVVLGVPDELAQSCATPARAAPPLPLTGIVHGEPFVERKSTFQAHLLAVTTDAEVDAFVAALNTVAKIRSATHNILAYRIVRADGTSHQQDFDDDGEAAAGGRLLHLLEIVGAENVAVVVSRWYGGVKLGPARFSHINNAARVLLRDCGFIAQEKLPKKERRPGNKSKGKKKKG